VTPAVVEDARGTGRGLGTVGGAGRKSDFARHFGLGRAAEVPKAAERAVEKSRSSKVRALNARMADTLTPSTTTPEKASIFALARPEDDARSRSRAGPMTIGSTWTRGSGRRIQPVATARAAGKNPPGIKNFSSRAGKTCGEKSAAPAGTPPPQIANVRHYVM
jgi:hypothetical protein